MKTLCFSLCFARRSDSWRRDAAAESTSVLVTVNDLPITDFDVDQRIKLWTRDRPDVKSSNRARRRCSR